MTSKAEMGAALKRADSDALSKNARSLHRQLRRFNPYSAYEDSGIEWLGKVPAHWDVAPVYSRYEVALGKMLDAKQTTGKSSGRYLRNVDVQWDVVNTEDLPEMDFEPSERKRYLLRVGDLLVCEGGEVGRTAIWRGEIEECFYQKAIHRLRPSSSSQVPRFFYYVMHALANGGVFIAGGNPNTINHLTAVVLKRYRFPFPPRREQETLAAFLDRETERIDSLVAKKEQLIQLLRERRTALITRAVTKGLDPIVPMKDSSVEWLGEIPAHWHTPKMWQISTARSGATPPRDERTYWNGEIPWVSPKDMKRRIIDSSEDSVTERAIEETGIRLIEPPVVLMVVRGMILAHSFPVALTTAPVTINQDMKALTFREDIHPDFIVWLFDGVGKRLLKTIVEEAAHGTRVIRMDEWRSVTVPLPPFNEQRLITIVVQRETARIDALVAKVREAIDRLREFRTALISAAVTGKIDVRGEVA